MLSKMESKIIFRFINSIFIPFGVDETSGELRALTSCKFVVWWLQFFLVTIHVLHSAIELTLSATNTLSRPPAPVATHIMSIRVDLIYLPVMYLSRVLLISVNSRDHVRHVFNHFYAQGLPSFVAFSPILHSISVTLKI